MTKSVSSAASAAPVRGIIYMVFAMFLLTAGDALTKHIGSHLPIGQVIFFRALFIYVPILVTRLFRIFIINEIIRLRDR